ncbi:MAG: sensor histidine kinase [Candidatus Cryptobacteroides sp.]
MEKFKNILVFLALGFFSYTLIVNYTDFSAEVASVMFTRGALVYTLLAFVVLGYATMLVLQWVSRKYVVKAVRKWQFYVTHCLIALLFLLINYSLLVLAKALANVEPVYAFSRSGWHLLILVWFAEMLIIELMLSKYTASENQKLKEEAARLKLENSEARYIALQNQLNPHFLFNSLNALISEIHYNPDNAEKFTRHLSNVYRYVLQCQDRRFVSVERELDFLESYIFLHRVRLGDCISYECEIPDVMLECIIPPLSLQLLVENVIKHNSISLGKPMTIRIYPESDNLVVVNHKSPKRTRPGSSGIGLDNLSARCNMLTGRDISVLDSEDEFIVKIPVRYEEG